MPRSQLYLIDAYGLCYRAFYAVRGLSNSKGQPTNAVFGFINILRKLLTDLKPTHVAACFDVGKKTKRHEKFADYKVQRQAMPDDLVSQIKLIHELLKSYNIPVLQLEGYEADDVMATLAFKYASKDTDVVIVTEDKDMGQLVDRGPVKVYSARQGKVLHQADIEEKFGVRPDQIVDYIALAGDTSDNIPGVAGVGEVTACKLLKEFGTLENIYKNIDNIKGKLKEKLEASRDLAFLSKELATLHPDVPLDITLDELAVKAPDKPRLLKLFQELEFRKLAEVLEQEGSDAYDTNHPVDEPISDFEHLVVLKRGGREITVVYDLKNLRKSGAVPEGKEIFDVYLAGYLLSGGQKFDIATLAWQHLNKKPYPEVLSELYDPLCAALQTQDLRKLYDEVELPLTEVLVAMETNGVRLDLDVLKKLSDECQGKMSTIEKEMFKIAGQEFNMNSPKQLCVILFEKLKLPVVKKTKTGYSTDEEVLTKLSSQHPLPALILEYRQLAKLKSTYLDALPQLADAKTHRVHASFNQMGAETGRLSSNSPNLQNIPIRTDLGKRIRAAFVPYEKNHILLAADYSQIELRILAHLSGDPNLKKAFIADEDIHRYTASLMFDVPENKIDEKMRYAAKRINFGIIYGMSSFGLAKDLDVGFREAQEFIDKYFLRYPQVQAFLDREITKAQDTGYVTTMFNRRRYLPDIKNRNMGLRQFAERQAINAPIQGTAADLIKLAMVQVSDELKANAFKSKMIMTVHDELVFDVLREEQDRMVELVRSKMENVMALSVPIKVTVKCGKNWLEMESK
jgi:DNA polymerase I